MLRDKIFQVAGVHNEPNSEHFQIIVGETICLLHTEIGPRGGQNTRIIEIPHDVYHQLFGGETDGAGK